jgi:hypothetical protein
MTFPIHHTRASPPNDSDEDDLPTIKTELKNFWDEAVPHVVLSTVEDGVPQTEVNVVVEDAIKIFCGIDDPSNLSKETKKCTEAIKSGMWRTFVKWVKITNFDI